MGKLNVCSVLGCHSRGVTGFDGETGRKLRFHRFPRATDEKSMER